MRAPIATRHPPILLLRIPPADRSATTDPEGHSLVLSTLIKAFVRLARAGDWDALIDQYEADSADLDETGGRTMRTSRVGDIDAHKAQAAGLSARTGALRSAAGILTGSPPVHSTPQITDMIRA